VGDDDRVGAARTDADEEPGVGELNVGERGEEGEVGAMGHEAQEEVERRQVLEDHEH